MKCSECVKTKATYQCKDCGIWYCEDCASMDYCHCIGPPNIRQVK